MNRSQKRGFTLVEFLVVVTLIGILVALLLPSVQYSRESSRRTHCQNNLKQIGLALLMKHDSHRCFPSGWVGFVGDRHEVNAGPGWSWAAQILPQLEQGNLAEKLDLHTSFLHERNSPARNTVLTMFRCPSDITKAKFDLRDKSGKLLGSFPTSNYVANFGAGRIPQCASLSGTGQACTGGPYEGVFSHNSCVSLSEIAGKGASRTILAGERDSTPLPNQAPIATWVGALLEVEGDFQRVLGSALHEIVPTSTGDPTMEFLDFSSNHHGGAYFVFADGHVEFLVKQMDDWEFVRLMTRFPEDDVNPHVSNPIADNEPTTPVISPPVDTPNPEVPPVVRPRRPISGGCPICRPRGLR